MYTVQLVFKNGFKSRVGYNGARTVVEEKDNKSFSSNIWKKPIFSWLSIKRRVQILLSANPSGLFKLPRLLER